MPRRRTWNDVAPNASTSPWKLARIPCTAAAMAVTTNTPTATPMMVRLARTLFERIASTAMPMPSLMIVRRSSRRIALFLAKSGDRIQSRGAACRVHAGDDANACADSECEQDGPWRDTGRQRRDGGDDLREPDPEADANG